MSTEKKYTYLKGSAREKVFNDGNSLINFSLNKDQIMDLPDNKGYVQLTIKANRGGEDMYGNTHHIVLNEFKPDSSKAGKTGKKQDDADNGGDDDLPF